MKTKLLLWCAAGWLVALTGAQAATLYVDAASSNAVPPFADWTTAAATIQDAVDAAAPGDEIVVTNGVYQTGARAVYGMSNRVAVTKAVTVRSVNGPEVTTIRGAGPIGENAIRCAYLTNGAVLAGFTLTNGATQDFGDWFKNQTGGGIWAESVSATVSNCVLSANWGWLRGGGAYGSTLIHCTLTGNRSDEAGGAASGSMLEYCTISGNSAASGGGGVAYSTLNYCILTGNVSEFGGGASESVLKNCTLTSNVGLEGGGAYASMLTNCTLTGNLADSVWTDYTYGGGASRSTLDNCTLTGNGAGWIEDGPGLGGGAAFSTLNNCVAYYNGAENYYVSAFSYSCTVPDPGGIGNITNAPAFVDLAGGNLRLQSNSPCINAGDNAYVAGHTDLDGLPRIVGGTVDMGAFEWQGTTRYVSAASTNPIAPYSSWEFAAATIQDAVDAAAPGDEIVVTNGVYQTGARAVYGMSNRVAVTKAVTVRSVNGPDVTSIVGSGPSDERAVRCVYLTNEAVLSGFTLTNGTTQVNDDPWVSSSSTSGGGLWCESQTAVVTNCVIEGNSAFAPGGGAYSGMLKHCTLRGNSAISGGGAAGSALNDCTLIGNLASSGWTASASGGGATWSALTNCTLVGNGADTGGGVNESTLDSCTIAGNGAGSAGGARLSTLTNCTITGNSVENGAGGVSSSTLNNCTLANNTAYGSSGGGAYASTLNNCIVTGNSAGGFGGGGAFLSTLNNCTLTGNKARNGGGATWSTLTNCIIYYNSNFESDDDGFEIVDNYNTSTINNSCTTPDPASGVGNITSAPVFLDLAGGNLRLQSNSPCINAGTNASVATSTDLDGRPRLLGGVVDMGAYEYQGPGTGEFIGWLQQSGLPTDGSADDVDTDHDHHNNWQEWVAGTDPTNALSVLRLASPVITPTNVTLTWASVTNRTYTLEQATNLGDPSAFSVLRSNLAGLPGTTSWTDTNAPVASPRFYQLRVSP